MRWSFLFFFFCIQLEFDYISHFLFFHVSICFSCSPPSSLFNLSPPGPPRSHRHFSLTLNAMNISCGNDFRLNFFRFFVFSEPPRPPQDSPPASEFTPKTSLTLLLPKWLPSCCKCARNDYILRIFWLPLPPSPPPKKVYLCFLPFFVLLGPFYTGGVYILCFILQPNLANSKWWGPAIEK